MKFSIVICFAMLYIWQSINLKESKIGIDLKEDLSRFQIIMKVPYPNLKSEKVKRRMETNKSWYSWQTICNIIQSYGRSIRSETDEAKTYILDSCFGDVRRYSGHMLPDYVKEAIQTVNV